MRPVVRPAHRVRPGTRRIGNRRSGAGAAQEFVNLDVIKRFQTRIGNRNGAVLPLGAPPSTVFSLDDRHSRLAGRADGLNVDAPLDQALRFLRDAAAKGPQKFEVNIVSTVPQDAALKVTLSLKNISLYDALRYVTQIAGVKLEIEENAVVISRAGAGARP